MSDLVWNGREGDDFAKAKLRHALAESELAFARVRGMKLRASEARTLKGTFPFPGHRQVSEWIHTECRPKAAR